MGADSRPDLEERWSLLTWHANGDPDAPDVTVTPLFRSSDACTFEEQDAERMAPATARSPRLIRLTGSTRAAI